MNKVGTVPADPGHPTRGTTIIINSSSQISTKGVLISFIEIAALGKPAWLIAEERTGMTASSVSVWSVDEVKVRLL
jgi:hypothetical protein